MKGLSGAATIAMLLLAVPLQGQTGPRGMRGQQGIRGQRGTQGQRAMQRRGGRQGGQGQRGQSQMDRRQMQTGAADRILWLREDLNLTDDQVADLKRTTESARAVQDDARLQMRAMRDQLRDGEATQGQFLDFMTERRDAQQQQQLDVREQTEAILSDEQKDQVASMRRPGSRGQRGMRQRRGGRGG
jgi:hypothetical protein